MQAVVMTGTSAALKKSPLHSASISHDLAFSNCVNTRKEHNMRIHELLEITPEQCLLEFNQNLTLDELSGYIYRKPTVKPQL